jgi:hypothetical protein
MVDARTTWIRAILDEQTDRLSKGKQRKVRFKQDGSISSIRPPLIQMVSELSQNITSRKLELGKDVTIMRARAISDNKYIADYKKSIKSFQEVIDLETEKNASIANHESEKIVDAETVQRTLSDVNEKLVEALDISNSTTNASKKGKSLSNIHDLNVLFRYESSKLLTISGRIQTDIIVSRKDSSAPRIEMSGGFHLEDNPFCFGDCL